MELIYKCKSCDWSGQESELDLDIEEMCSGPEKIEICPVCGSMNVHIIDVGSTKKDKKGFVE